MMKIYHNFEDKNLLATALIEELMEQEGSQFREASRQLRA